MESTPDNYQLGAGDLKVDDTSVGYTTKNGVVVKVEPDLLLAKSGKYGSTPVRAFLIGQKVEVEVEMAENTADNYAVAMAGATLSGESVKLGGIAGKVISGHIITLEPFDGSKVWTFKNCIPTSSVELAYKPGELRVIKVTFTGMVDTGEDDDENIAIAEPGEGS